MADTTETAPGTHPDAVKINDDGTIDTGGRRPAWVWCKDTGTGHRFDYPAERLPRFGVEPIPDVPVNYHRQARQPKPYVGKDGEAATPAGPTVDTGAPPAPAPDGDGPDGGSPDPARQADTAAAGEAPTDTAGDTGGEPTTGEADTSKNTTRKARR